MAGEAIALQILNFQALTPSYVSATFLEVSVCSSRSPKESIDKAVELAQKAISLDPKDSRPYAYLGFLSLLKKNYGKAIAEGERAVALDPGGADAHAWLGLILNYSTGPGKLFPYLKRRSASIRTVRHFTFTISGTPIDF